MSNLLSRLLVAVVAVPILLLLIYQDNPIFVWGLVFAGSSIAMYEFFSMTKLDKTDSLVSVVIGMAVLAAFYWLGEKPGGYLLCMVASVVAPMFYYLFRFGDQSTVASRLTSTITGIIYAGVFLSFVALIKRDFGAAMGPDKAGHLIIMLLGSAWLSDTGGYFAGKGIGGPKLYPAVSPNKTWSGSIGGVICAIGGGIAIKIFLLEQLEWIDVILLAGVGSILGQLGDLAESLIKRSTGVKDSGAILPGHGGILDRIDAVILIAPYFYLYVVIRGW